MLHNGISDKMVTIEFLSIEKTNKNEHLPAPGGDMKLEYLEAL